VRKALVARFESLAAELRDFIRKSDWNNRAEPRGREQDAWLRALHVLAGERQTDFRVRGNTQPVARPLGSLGARARRAWQAFRPPKQVGLDLAGIKLEAALERTGCPICHLAAEATRRWLFMLLWEGVMDPQTRSRVRAADGFCSAHWWQLLEVERKEMYAVSGTAILAEDTLTSLSEQLGTARIPAGPSPRTCLACAAHRRGEDGALSSASRHMTRPEFRSAYFASAGCCEDHRQALSWRIEQPDLVEAVIQHSH
jgi:hypothetical protein